VGLNDSEILVVKDITEDFVANLTGKSPDVVSESVKTVMAAYIRRVQLSTDNDSEASYIILRTLAEAHICARTMQTTGYDLGMKI
jgi:hypothetical protein